MRILHTSDWHLGKTLEGYSRLEEQQQFIDEFLTIIENNKIDIVIIAGDIYDNSNPSSSAETLFYNSIKKICASKKTIVLIIAGNHDSPERLTAASSLAYEQGIIMLGTPKSIAQQSDYGIYKIVNSGEGFLEIEFKNEKAVIITLPYPSEKRLNELINEELESEEEQQKSYSNKVCDIFNKLSTNYREDTINIAVGHFFMMGGEETDSERPIQLGGSLAVSPSALPEKAQYIALGHLHRPQKVRGTELEAYYSGSPIQYSKSEINYSKNVYIVDLKPKSKPLIQKVLLKNYKPIEIWECSNVDEAITKCEQNKNRNVWVYLYIHTDDILLHSEKQQMKHLKKDILAIQTIPTEKQKQTIDDEQLIEDIPIQDLFKEFYLAERQAIPSNEILDLFLDIFLGSDIDETENS